MVVIEKDSIEVVKVEKVKKIIIGLELIGGGGGCKKRD